MRPITLSLISAVWLVVVLSGCENSPTQPISDSPTGPTTASAAVDSFSAGIARLDSTLLKSLLSPDFELLTGRSNNDLGNGLLTREQTVRGLANLCSRIQPGSSCQIDSVSIYLSPSNDWTTVEEGMPFAGSLTRLYRIQLHVIGTECDLNMSFGNLWFYVDPVPGGQSTQEQSYQLRGLKDYTQPKDKMPSLSFSKLLARFLYAGLPAARLIQDLEEGTELL